MSGLLSQVKRLILLRHSSQQENSPGAVADTQNSAPEGLVFVGSVVPDQPDFHGPAFSRAGNMFQENLLTGLRDAGLSASFILSQRPLRAFPRSRTVWFSGGQVSLNSGLPVRLVPFLNLPFLRPVTVGLAMLVNLIRWDWRHRRLSQKVVYTFNLTEPPGFFTLVGARLIGARAVASVSDVNVPGQTVPASLARRLDFWLQKKLIPRFDGLVVVSRRIIEDLAPLRPFVRIEGAVRDSVLQMDHEKVSSGAGAPLTIVSLGTLDEANGFVELLESFSLLPGDGYRLRIAGMGPLDGMVREAAARDARIEYCGYLSFEEVLDLYKTADLLVNMRITQRLQTDYFFPSKLIEYLATGVPVITTCTGHVEEEYGDFVFLLHEETPEGLAHMIEQVAAMRPETRARKGQAAQEYIRNYGTWEVQGRRVANFIRGVILS